MSALQVLNSVRIDFDNMQITRVWPIKTQCFSPKAENSRPFQCCLSTMAANSFSGCHHQQGTMLLCNCQDTFALFPQVELSANELYINLRFSCLFLVWLP